MMLPHSYSQTIELLREGVTGQDEYGNDVRGPVTVQVPGCMVWPSDGNGTGGNERVGDLDVIVVGYTVLAPSGTQVKATDRVRLPGDPQVWDVIGRPAEWRSPFTGTRSGVQITLGVVL